MSYGFTLAINYIFCSYSIVIILCPHFYSAGMYIEEELFLELDIVYVDKPYQVHNHRKRPKLNFVRIFSVLKFHDIWLGHFFQNEIRGGVMKKKLENIFQKTRGGGVMKKIEKSDHPKKWPKSWSKVCKNWRRITRF